jgi:hypothetical protein
MLGLYCYRAGYYPAALAQWTRIPQPNRALRPDITRLLDELDSRLALEKQETQPMLRQAILKQPPILTGNLGPADLPNPHDPVTIETAIDDSLDTWIAPLSGSLDIEKSSTVVATRSEEHPNGSGSNQARDEEEAVSPTPHQSWLARRRRSSKNE